jgi:hypothetical protein
MFRVGDRIRLKGGRSFAGLRPGEVGTVTSVEGFTFSVNGRGGCQRWFWEHDVPEVHKAPDRFKELVSAAERELAEIEADLAKLDEEDTAFPMLEAA